jgi:hypothetical protein
VKSIVPTELLPPEIPSTLQVTLALESPCNVAVNCWVAPGKTSAESGDMLSENTMTVALAVPDGFPE